MIGARLRHELGWSDARILNLSSHGMMIRTSKAPPRGTYVEICRGTHRIVARVVWADGDRFGARAQDSVAVDAIAAGEDAPLPVPANFNEDRRRWQREAPPAETHERSRRWSQGLQFLCVAAFGCAAAFFAFATVHETLSKPLILVEARLSKG
jgi:hypothetical protein